MSVATANEFRIEEDALGDVQVPGRAPLGCTDPALSH